MRFDVMPTIFDVCCVLGVLGTRGTRQVAKLGLSGPSFEELFSVDIAQDRRNKGYFVPFFRCSEPSRRRSGSSRRRYLVRPWRGDVISSWMRCPKPHGANCTGKANIIAAASTHRNALETKRWIGCRGSSAVQAAGVPEIIPTFPPFSRKNFAHDEPLEDQRREIISS